MYVFQTESAGFFFMFLLVILGLSFFVMKKWVGWLFRLNRLFETLEAQQKATEQLAIELGRVSSNLDALRSLSEQSTQSLKKLADLADTRSFLPKEER